MRASGKYVALRDYPGLIGDLIREPLTAPMLGAKIAWGRLRHGLGPRDFFEFELRNRPMSTWGGYLSDVPHMRRVCRALHPKQLSRVADDKVQSTERFLEHGVAVAPVIAVAGRDSERYPSKGVVPVINDADALAARLDAGDIPERLFCKPAAGAFGHGVFRAERADGGWTLDDRRMTSADLAAHVLAQEDPAGTLIMPELRNHPALEPISANLGLSTTRVYTARTASGPENFCTVQKVMMVQSLADNFANGAPGHLLGNIDPVSGRITGAFGRSPGDKLRIRNFATHEVTGQRFADFVIPFWDETLALAYAAAEAMPELPIPGFDIALTGDGPVVLEANAYCFTIAPQLQHGALRPVLENLIPRLLIDPERRDDALWALRTGQRHTERRKP